MAGLASNSSTPRGLRRSTATHPRDAIVPRVWIYLLVHSVSGLWSGCTHHQRRRRKNLDVLFLTKSHYWRCRLLTKFVRPQMKSCCCFDVNANRLSRSTRSSRVENQKLGQNTYGKWVLACLSSNSSFSQDTSKTPLRIKAIRH